MRISLTLQNGGISHKLKMSIFFTFRFYRLLRQSINVALCIFMSCGGFFCSVFFKIVVAMTKHPMHTTKHVPSSKHTHTHKQLQSSLFYCLNPNYANRKLYSHCTKWHLCSDCPWHYKCVYSRINAIELISMKSFETYL